ncbi:MAG: 50S ribosomal protein L6 [Bifidobacterium dentium]
MASHIGKLPVAIPAGVEVKIDGQSFTAKGAKGTDSYEIPEGITASGRRQRELSSPRSDDLRPTRAKHGLARSIIASMVKGVHEGYAKTLEIVGTGYRAQMKGKGIEFSLGYSHTITVEPPAGIEFELPNPNQVIVKGIDKQAVGQCAANIRKLRAPEPYKGKGIKYSDEHILRKAGKAGK